MSAKARKPVNTDVHIRWMIRRDLHEVLEIERDCFPNPWSQDDFIRCLRQRNCIGMVAEHKGRIAGFVMYELHNTRLRLLNIAVGWGYQRNGVGRAMIDKLKGKLSFQRRTSILVSVREGNLDAQLFFKAMGFVCVSIAPGDYEDSGEDAYLFRYSL